MTTDALLHGENADDLRELRTRVRRSRLTVEEWAEVATTLVTLRDALRRGTAREVLRAMGVFDDLVGVRVRAEPGALPVDGPPDEVVHLVHEVELATDARLAGLPADDQ
ncbi:hypothetical protein [Saccharothrix sp. Mg75]|uniref:hypothetical protein n=1 Tax=Saccharothrix sp. Mg75 TaxID=3445357 RepID=UPI003EEE6501